MTKSRQFRSKLLHPRYWFTWFGLGVLWLLVQLPYPILIRLGAGAGKLSRHFLKRRERITRRNIELCFPNIKEEKIEAMIAGNFESLGMALAETGIAWFWSDARVRRYFEVHGLENLQHAQSHQRGVMVIGVHFMSLELGGRITGLCQPMMAMYRPHNNQAMEWAQTKGRMRSNKAMIDRRDLRGMVQALKKRRSGLVRTGSGLWPQRQRVCSAVCGETSGDHQRHLCFVSSGKTGNADHRIDS